VNLLSHRAMNCCHVISDEMFQISRKNGLDRLAACISLGESARGTPRPCPLIDARR